ncbi:MULTISPECIES: hypothetical protein [unclassified Bartonella]|uniref:hypothetical protein n=1 Tax=unclassified Bartonella TaxID=2645622 RepID=UPI0035D0F030
MCNIHYLKDIAVNTFENCKAELKGSWFSLLWLHILTQLGFISISEITPLGIRNILIPIWHTKTGVARRPLIRLNIPSNMHLL